MALTELSLQSLIVLDEHETTGIFNFAAELQDMLSTNLIELGFIILICGLKKKIKGILFTPFQLICIEGFIFKGIYEISFWFCHLAY